MISKGVILIVDDEETIRFSIKEFLEGKGYEVHVAETSEQALENINELLPDLILLDLRLPTMGGIALLEKVKVKDPNVLMIVMTGYGSIDSAVEAMKRGAYDYLEKPFKVEHLRLVIEKALSTQALRREVLELRAQQWTFTDEPGGIIIGNSQPMKEIYNLIKQVAKSPSTTVLIQGESGIALQSKLLRVLQERQFKRVGGINDIKIDVRVIASTNRNLEEEVDA